MVACTWTSACIKPAWSAAHNRSAKNGGQYGMIYGMKTTIDSAGRLVIPKEIRQQAGIQPGTPLEIRLREGCIEIEPAAAKIRLERRGRLIVAVPQEPVPQLTADIVEKTRHKLRRERGAVDK